MIPLAGARRLFLVLLLVTAGFPPVKAEAQSASLIDHHGNPFVLDRLKGQVVMVFFGYTSCPDVCPMELSLIARVLAHYGNSQPLHGLFVSIDPQRDTPERLREYVSHFGEGITGLTGSAGQLQNFARQFNASYQVVQKDSGDSKVDHTSNLYVLDKQGGIDTVIPFGMSYEHIQRVVEWILNQSHMSG